MREKERSRLTGRREHLSVVPRAGPTPQRVSDPTSVKPRYPASRTKRQTVQSVKEGGARSQTKKNSKKGKRHLAGMYLLPALYPLTMNVYGSPSSDQPHLRQSFYPPHRGQEQEGTPMTRTKRAGAGAPPTASATEVGDCRTRNEAVFKR